MTDRHAALERARRVADTVLYEGYVLYPYRASARKNHIRWQFGVLAPRPFSDSDGSEQWSSQTECVLAVEPATVLDVKVRFLRIQARRIEEADGAGDGQGFRAAPSLDVDGRFFTDWDEAVEEEIDVHGLRVSDLLAGEHLEPIVFEASAETEPVVDDAGRMAGRIRRTRASVSARLRVVAEPVESATSLVRVRARVENVTDWCAAGASRDDVLPHSLASVHLVLVASQGQFVSMIDPPDDARSAVAACHNEGMWPVLVGDEGSGDVVLASPITLYDYPEIAPESEGDFCDATEIDEILALRVMTLTDEEKRQARGTDIRAAGIVERCDSMPAEIFERLHGAVRSLRAIDPDSMQASVDGALATSEPGGAA